MLVGHAVHHDLRALRLDYQPVIDTSLLLAYRHGQLFASEHNAAIAGTLEGCYCTLDCLATSLMRLWEPVPAWRSLQLVCPLSQSE